MVRINGVDTDAAGMTLAAYLKAEGYAAERVAVERNEEIVPKAEYDTTLLCDGDVIEVVRFVGGG